MSTETNKEIVTRYNKEVIEGCNMDVLEILTTPGFVNHSAAPGMPEGVEGMMYFFKQILHSSFSEVRVEIREMLAEGNKVATRKEITAMHTGELMGIPATGKTITLKVIDILAIDNGRISDHWGENNFIAVLQSLSQ
ncbi:ester cyclase [Desertivirga brevis]|uniref:ester cyclase n=1 Tax=Desertivirga brevis TaxID=2810310 RepID=UPI001A9691D7|nr:ester cyclase [Pedobacter sp. SYSU D00873]